MVITKHKIVLLVVVMLFSSGVMAQKKNNKKKDKAKQEEKSEPVEDVIMMEVVEEVAPDRGDYSSSSTAPIEFLDNIRFNNKYEISSSINDDYDWFSERYANNNSKKYGIVNKKGDVILLPLFSRDYYTSSGNYIIMNLENTYGLFNLTTLQWGIPMEYEYIRSLNNNLYIAKKNGKYGVVDNNNNTILNFEWQDIERLSDLDNYVMISDFSYPQRLMGIYSLIDKKFTVPCAYSSLSTVDGQNYFRAQLGSTYNIVDINNAPRFKKWYDDLTIPSRSGGYYIVKVDNKFGVIDDSEKQIVPINMLEIGRYPYSDGSYLARNKEGKYGFILLDGRITLPFQYDNLIKERNNNVISIQNGKCGLVQVNVGTPQEIVTCNYDDIKSTSKIFIVEKNKQFGLLNEYGRTLTEIEYQSLEVLNSGSRDTQIIKAKKDNSYLLLNELGKPISTTKYTDISVVVNKNTSYYGIQISYLKALDKNKKYSLVDKVGQAITKPIFDDITLETQNILTVKSKDKYGLYYILDQKLVVDYEYDQIVFTKNNYIGFKGNKIELLQVRSGVVTKLTGNK